MQTRTNDAKMTKRRPLRYDRYHLSVPVRRMSALERLVWRWWHRREVSAPGNEKRRRRGRMFGLGTVTIEVEIRRGDGRIWQA